MRTSACSVLMQKRKPNKTSHTAQHDHLPGTRWIRRCHAGGALSIPLEALGLGGDNGLQFLLALLSGAAIGSGIGDLLGLLDRRLLDMRSVHRRGIVAGSRCDAMRGGGGGCDGERRREDCDCDARWGETNNFSAAVGSDADC